LQIKAILSAHLNHYSTYHLYNTEGFYKTDVNMVLFWDLISL
jgi:hypothetical protein